MFFQQDYNAPPEEESPEAVGPRRFFQIISQETAALLKLNLMFLLSCLPVVTIPPPSLRCTGGRAVLWPGGPSDVGRSFGRFSRRSGKRRTARFS